MKELDQIFRPVKKSWMLNQRMYGAFEGIAREDLKAEIGMDRIAEYRRSLFLKPPPMSEAHPRWHRDESKYRHVDREDIPLTESIWDCFQRVRPLYSSCILPDLISGKNVLVVAHDHSLRGIIDASTTFRTRRRWISSSPTVVRWSLSSVLINGRSPTPTPSSPPAERSWRTAECST